MLQVYMYSFEVECKLVLAHMFSGYQDNNLPINSVNKKYISEYKSFPIFNTFNPGLEMKSLKG